MDARRTENSVEALYYLYGTLNLVNIILSKNLIGSGLVQYYRYQVVFAEVTLSILTHNPKRHFTTGACTEKL